MSYRMFPSYQLRKMLTSLLTAPDAIDKLKGALKGIFKRKSKKNTAAEPTATENAPTETQPPAPEPSSAAAASEPAKAAEPAAPQPASAPGMSMTLFPGIQCTTSSTSSMLHPFLHVACHVLDKNSGPQNNPD
jgi:hypothetical protein